MVSNCFKFSRCNARIALMRFAPVRLPWLSLRGRLVKPRRLEESLFEPLITRAAFPVVAVETQREVLAQFTIILWYPVQTADHNSSYPAFASASKRFAVRRIFARGFSLKTIERALRTRASCFVPWPSMSIWVCVISTLRQSRQLVPSPPQTPQRSTVAVPPGTPKQSLEPPEGGVTLPVDGGVTVGVAVGSTVTVPVGVTLAVDVGVPVAVAVPVIVGVGV